MVVRVWGYQSVMSVRLYRFEGESHRKEYIDTLMPLIYIVLFIGLTIGWLHG